MRKRVAFQAVRDAAVLAFGAFLAVAGYAQLSRELVFAVLLGIGIALVALTLIELFLLARKARRKGFYYANAVLQLPMFFIMAGLLGLIGAALLVLDIIVLVLLKKEKPAA